MTSGSVFELTTDAYPSGELAVVSFRGVEEISRPFSFEILLFGRGVARGALERDLLGQRAHLVMAGADDAARTIHGVVRRVEAEGISGGGEDRHRYRAWLVPRLWLLGRNKNSRIFQDKTVREIIDQILSESSVASRWSLMGDHPPRGYCVQYQESDLRFIQRLLAEEGIFYSFDFPEGEREQEVVVFTDEAPMCGPIAGATAMELRDSGGMVEREQEIRRFRLGLRVRPGSTLLREFDFRRPSLDLSAGADARGATGPDLSFATRLPDLDLSSLPQPPAGFVAPEGLPDPASILGSRGAPSRGGGSDTPLFRVYDHHGEFEGAGVDVRVAQRHLQQHRTRATLGEGESRCRRLVPGRWFELHGAPLPEHDGRYALLRVEHEGHHPEAAGVAAGGAAAPEVYKNRFWCIPADVPCRPRRPRRRIQQVVETATVVGPPGQEIHTDSHGRIKVQFHWDRQGRRNEHSSCWIRTLQAWAGTGWGFQFIPRVGMEVLVTFVGGDTDRPMVMGSVYNAEHPPPFPLPASKTKSGIRTRSSKGGAGFNELSFEDRKGWERIHVRAEKDYDEAIGNTRMSTVGASDTLTVGGQQVIKVGSLQATLVGGNQVVSVAGDRTEAIAGTSAATIAGAATLRIGASARVAIARDAEVEIKGHAATYVGGSASYHSMEASTLLVGDEEKPAPLIMSSWGDLVASSAATVRVASSTKIVLACGGSSITLDKDGITLASKKITVSADDEVVAGVKNSKHSIKKDEILMESSKVTIHGSGSTLALDSKAKLQGSKVALESGGGGQGSSSSQSDSDDQAFRLKVQSQSGAALANTRYALVLGTTRLKGSTDGAGVIDRRIPKGHASAELLLFTDEGTIRAAVRLSEEDFDSSDRDHLVQGLKNLGYLAHGRDDEGGIREAALWFQQKEGLTLTGTLDDATAQKIASLLRG